MISKYNNFLIDKILESINESYLYYTKDFKNILSKMKKNKIASDILDSAGVDMKGDMTFIDLSDKEGHISFSQIKKAISVINKWVKDDGIFVDLEGNPNSEIIRITDGINDGRFNINDDWRFKKDLLNKSRNDVKIGKLVNSLFPGKYTAQEVEEFVGKFKRYASGEENNTFELIEGDAIKAAYLHSNYVSESGTLGNSCMRYDSCQDYFEIYTKNPEVCKMLLLKNEEDEILGRVLVWKFTNIDKDELKSAEYFMDRIYTYTDSIITDFKDYSDKNNWIRRTNTGYSDCRTLTYMDEVYNNVGMEVNLENYSNIDEFPYMDTFKRLNIEDGILYNDDKQISGCYGLEQTGGDYASYEGVWSDYYDEYIPENEATYSRPLGTNIYSENCIWVNIGQNSRQGAYPEGYDGILYDEFRDEYIHEDDSIYCKYDGRSFYDNDAVDVITEFNGIVDYNHEQFSDMCDDIVKSNELQCYKYLFDEDLEDYYFHKDILGANFHENDVNNGYYFKKFKVKVYKTNLGNYTQVDCDILGIKNIPEFDVKGNPNNFMSDDYAYNYKLNGKDELKEKCKEKIEHYNQILNGDQSRIDFEDEDNFKEKSKEMLEYFSKRYDELESF